MCTGVKIVLDVSCGTTTTTSTTTITAATTTATNNVVMKSEMKYQSRVCFLTLFLACVSVNAYCQSTELQIKVPLLSFSNKSTGRVSPAQKKNKKKTWQTVSIMSELQRKQFFFSEKFCSMAAFNSDKHQCGAFWKSTLHIWVQKLFFTLLNHDLTDALKKRFSKLTDPARDSASLSEDVSYYWWGPQPESFSSCCLVAAPASSVVARILLA